MLMSDQTNNPAVPHVGADNIQERLAYAEAIVGKERTPQGEKPLTAAQMGHLVAQRYGQIDFLWTKAFQDYRLVINLKSPTPLSYGFLGVVVTSQF